MRGFLSDIIAKVQLDDESVELESIGDSGRYWSIEGERKNGGGEERYLVYDCSEQYHEFDFGSYKAEMEVEEGISRTIMVFKNWDREWELRQKAYKKLCKAADKKQLLRWFEKKIPFYTELGIPVELEVDGRGENYLEYKTNLPSDQEGEARYLSGRSYNISFRELKKIFNVTGKELFRRNVRFGLKNNNTGNQLQSRFKEYIKIGAYMKWKEEHPGNVDDNELKMIFEIKEEAETRVPQNFWFYHNGITIFYYGEEGINFSGNHIKFDPKKVSVINGAQTLTNFYEGMKMLPEEFALSCFNYIEEESRAEVFIDFFSRYIDEAMGSIKVKTIFIEGPEGYVQPITYGLNTQIPIMEADIIADSDEVERINQYLQKRNMKIIKTGEVENVEKGFSVLEFVKYYLIVKGKPGKSKNLRRADVKTYIQEAEQDFVNKPGKEKILDDMYDVYIIEKWWKASKKIREENYAEEKQKVYNNNAKNYFESFVLIEKKETLDDEYLMLLYDMFIDTFIGLEGFPDVKMFKNDILFEKYYRLKLEVGDTGGEFEAEAKRKDDILNIKSCDELRDFLNNEKPSPYIVQKSIRKFLSGQGREIPYFRVIARTDGKVREAFPFPSSTFSEIYQDQTEGERKQYKKYEESSFCKEIGKQFPIFVIDWLELEGEGREVENVRFINGFSFNLYNKQARQVYEQTIRAFENGDEEEFPKMKDNMMFHVRTKAVNAEDTFEFSNGKQITKRTFWANKNTLDILLDGMISAGMNGNGEKNYE